MKTTNKMFKKLNINKDMVSKKWFNFGCNVEMEHKNIAHDNETIYKIVIAHLEELPDYYKRLKKLEASGNKYWKNKDKNIYL